MSSEPFVYHRTAAPANLASTALASDETNTLAPGASWTQYISGPRGGTVVSSLERAPNSGGHVHGGNTSDPAAVGTISPNNFRLDAPYPQNVRVVFRAPMVAGIVRGVDIVTAHSGETRRFEYAFIVKIAGLQAIPESANLRLKAPTAVHPSPYWATASFIAKLQTLANLYASASGKPITITDGSLEWGGRFDLNQDWGGSHFEHSNGRVADIRSNDMTEQDKVSFMSAAGAAQIIVLEEGNHWHVTG